MIYDLHTLVHKHTLTQAYNQLACSSRSGVATTAEGYTRSVPGALDWQVGSCDVGKLKTMLPLSLENPLQAPWKERKGGRIRKRGREQGMMFSIVFLLQWKCHYRPPCVCVQLRASYIKALRLFNNSRAPLMERQMGQWWRSRRCLCEPTERKWENLSSTCRLLEVDLPGRVARCVLLHLTLLVPMQAKTQDEVNKRSPGDI